MPRLLALLFFINIGLLAVALIDCLSSERSEIRTLPKAAWVLIILLFPAVGPGIWFASGRPSGPAESGSDQSAVRAGAGQSPKRGAGRVVAPDDDPEFLRGLSETIRKSDEDRLRAWEDDLHRRERELRRRSETETEDGPGGDQVQPGERGGDEHPRDRPERS